MGLRETFGWPWPIRERTTAEYEHVINSVQEQCIRRGMSEGAALAEAQTVARLLPINTEQPIGAARWLEKRFGYS